MRITAASRGISRAGSVTSARVEFGSPARSRRVATSIRIFSPAHRVAFILVIPSDPRHVVLHGRFLPLRRSRSNALRTRRRVCVVWSADEIHDPVFGDDQALPRGAENDDVTDLRCDRREHRLRNHGVRMFQFDTGLRSASMSRFVDLFANCAMWVIDLHRLDRHVLRRTCPRLTCDELFSDWCRHFRVGLPIVAMILAEWMSFESGARSAQDGWVASSSRRW
jgi:hypothetical protein